jgi:hypothetical protein
MYPSVQVSDTVSGFFGGNVNNRSIVTFDWTTGSYTKHPAELEGERLRSSCALMTNKEGISRHPPPANNLNGDLLSLKYFMPVIYHCIKID